MNTLRQASIHLTYAVCTCGVHTAAAAIFTTRVVCGQSSPRLCALLPPPQDRTLTIAFLLCVLLVVAMKSQLEDAPPSSTNSRLKITFLLVFT